MEPVREALAIESNAARTAPPGRSPGTPIPSSTSLGLSRT